MATFSSRRVAGILAISAGLASACAAQDCRLSLSASDHFLSPGEKAEVYVWAHFAPTAYAFASSTFDVEADSPGWSFASSGAIAAGSVLGAEASQPHQPRLGLPADPANPKRIWHGTFVPETWEPRCIAIEATPTDFEIYPSVLTGSSAPCPADPGNTRIIIEPVVVGNIAYAPMFATPLKAGWHPSGGIQVLLGDGSVRPIGAGVRIGLLLPAVQQVRETAARIETTGRPTSLGIIAILIGLLEAPTEQMTLNFTKVEESYQPSIDLASAAGSRYRLFRDGRLLSEHPSSDGRAPFVLGGLPSGHTMRLGDGRVLDIHSTVLFDEPIPCIFPGGASPLVDRIEVVTATRLGDVEKVSIALQTFEAEPDREPITLGMILDVDCRADLDGDGATTFFDFLAFQDLFASGDLLGDFTADGKLDFFDFLAFQDEFARGCD